MNEFILINELIEVRRATPVAVFENVVTVPAKRAGEIIPDDIYPWLDFSQRLLRRRFQKQGFVSLITGQVTPCFDHRRGLRRNSRGRARLFALKVHVSRRLFYEIFLTNDRATTLLEMTEAAPLRERLAILHPLVLGECRGTRLFVVKTD